jgi:hypothetical protein
MTERTMRSPKITPISWGRIEVDTLGVGKGFKLYPAGGRAWDWNETGTRHVPGIQPSGVAELLDHGSTIIVLSRGMQLVPQTCPETLELLRGGNHRSCTRDASRSGVVQQTRRRSACRGAIPLHVLTSLPRQEEQDAEARGVRPCARRGADEARTVS